MASILRFLFPFFIFYFILLDYFLDMRTGFHIIHQYEKGVVFRLGTYRGLEEAGLNFVWPMLDRVIIVKSWDRVIDIPKQGVVTKDLVTLSVDGVIRYKVVDPKTAIIDIDNFNNATIEFALATLKEAVGEIKYTTLISKRAEVNNKIKSIVEEKASTWGVKIKDIEIKNLVAMDAKIQNALTQRAIAEQEKIARLIASNAEIEISKNLKKASEEYGLSKDYAFELRRLHSLEEFSKMGNGNFLLPLNTLMKQPKVYKNDKQ